MSNYSKTTNFATKDALASGNPLKTIKGTEFNVEFDAIEVASATKANIAAPTFTGVPSAPTASVGTDTTQIATTAFANASATAAAATALLKSGGAMTGAITTNSTFDGRDVAADGVTADAALPKSGGAMTGAITTNSTFDGRDVAADGVTADAALPKAGGAMTGAITTNSTFDGRDVGTDGTKLDTVATNANNYTLPSTLPASMLTGALPAISGASLTDLPAGGAEDFVASGTLPNGSKVVLKANGQVEVVAISAAAVAADIPAGTAVTFKSTNAEDTQISFDRNTTGKFILTYRDTSNNYGMVLSGTISGTSLSFGTAATFNAGSTLDICCEYNPNTANQFVIVFKDGGNNNYGKAIVGTVSGTSISMGSEYTFESAIVQYLSMSFDPNTSGKFVVAFRDSGNNGKGKTVIGTISGTSISWGSEAIFFNVATTYIKVAYDKNTANKFLVTYSSSSAYYARVGSVSNTSVTFGTETQVSAFAGNANLDMQCNPNVTGQFVLIMLSSQQGYVYSLTISGTNVSASAATNWVYDPSNMRIAFDPSTSGAFGISYRGVSNYQYVASGSVSGSTFTFLAPQAVTSVYSNSLSIGFDPNSALKFVTASSAANNSFSGKIVVGLIGKGAVFNLTSTNFLGTSTAAYTNGQTATIMLQGGVSTNQSSLAIGSTYYVQIDGTLATSADSTSGAPSVVAGKAVSATTLLLKGI